MRVALAATGIALVLAIPLVILLNPAAPYTWNLPESYPLPRTPPDNPMSEAKVELGRHLFYDRRLSINGTTSCGTCHRQSLAFTDGLAQAVGATGELHPRSSMSLVNVAYAARLNWANHLVDRLEIQALTPLFGEDPVEMGVVGRENEILALLRQDPYYSSAVPQAFPGDADPYSLLNLLRAIASFVRSIVSFDSPYDRYLHGDASALSTSAVRGMALFFSERLECFHCHGGVQFTDSSTHADSVIESVGFHNNGLYNIAGTGAYPPDNTGLFDITGERRDMGRFKAPTLRNISVTAPYMHDGSLETLDAVIRHYEAGGRSIAQGSRAGDGSRNPYKSPFIKGFSLSDQERAELLDFLAALTDEPVLHDPRFADPFAGKSTAAGAVTQPR
ncbi:MAG: di-heme enzyme [Woeseiaceae bacterium]|nr:di-heme enzyme [Woeseiaceae bacterium]